MNKRFKFLISVLVIIYTLFLSGCNACANKTTMTQPNTETLIKPTDKTIGVSSNVKPLNKFEYRFYSPNKKHYISENLTFTNQEGDFPSNETSLYYGKDFIDHAAYYLGYEEKQNESHAIWLDDENVLIKGTYIYHIGNKTKNPVAFPEDFLNFNHILNFRLEPEGKYISYMTVTALKEGKPECTLNVMLYKLNDKTWRTIYKQEIVWWGDWLFDLSGMQIFWDAQDNLYFSYSVKNDYMQVVRYNIKTDQAQELSDRYALQDVSPDGKYFIVFNAEDNINKTSMVDYVIESATQRKIIEIPLNARMAWSQENPDEFAVITDDTDNNNLQYSDKTIPFNVEIISLKEGKVIRTIRDKRFNPTPPISCLIDHYAGEGYVVSTCDKTFLIK